MIEIASGINVKIDTAPSNNGFIYNDVDVAIYKDNALNVAISYRSVDLYELNDGSINIYDYDNSGLVLVDKYLPSGLKEYNVRVIDTNHRQTSNERLQRNFHKINKLKQGTKNQIMYKI